MKLFNALLLSGCPVASSSVASMESADFTLPEDLEEHNEDTHTDLEVSYEQYMSDYRTIMTRVGSLEDALKTIGNGENLNMAHGAMIESVAEQAVEGTDLDAETDVVPGLEAAVVGKNVTFSTEGIKETIAKLVAAGKAQFKKALATLGKILGSVRAKGYLVKESLKETIEKVKAGTISEETASFQLKGLAALFTTDENVPNDAAELSKFLDGQIKIAKAVTTDSLKLVKELSPKLRKEYGNFIDGKSSAREAIVAIGKVTAPVLNKWPATLTSVKYDNRLFDYATERSEYIGGNVVIANNYKAVAKELTDNAKDDEGTSSVYAGIISRLGARVEVLKQPDRKFKDSKVTPFTSAEFAKLADKVLELVDTILQSSNWVEYYESEYDYWWDLWTDARAEGNWTISSIGKLRNTLISVLDLQLPYYRQGIKRLMSVADNSSKLLSSMAKETVVAK